MSQADSVPRRQSCPSPVRLQDEETPDSQTFSRKGTHVLSWLASKCRIRGLSLEWLPGPEWGRRPCGHGVAKPSAWQSRTLGSKPRLLPAVNASPKLR